MPKVQANIDIAIGDDMRVRPRQGGGFHVLIGPPGDHVAMLSFSDVAQAEALAFVLTTSVITHGGLGAAVAATSNVKPFPVRAAKADGPPLDAA